MTWMRASQEPVITPGVGKTMLAIGLARKVAEAGHRTYFTNAADLAARCHRAALEGRWATPIRLLPVRATTASTRSGPR